MFRWTIGRLPGCLSVAAVVLATLGAPASADHYPRQPGIDVQGYTFRIELKDGTSAIAGEADVDFVIRMDGVAEIAFDLVGASTDGATGMTVSAVTSGSDAWVFTHERNRLRIQLPPAARAGDRHRVSVRYSGTPADGLLIGPNKYGDRVVFGDNFPDRARHWLPTIDHPYDKAACEFAITAPEAYQVVAPGALAETTSLSGSRRLTRFRETEPITTYCMVIGVGRFAVETIGPVNGVPIQSWVYPSERDPGFADFRIAVKPMELFAWRIGPYPYEKLANVQSKSRYGGMENASAIFYREGVVTGKGTNEGLFAHEIAHQWFGDSVTESDWDHTWLSEGFATYFTHVYNEYTVGRDAMVRGLRRDRDTVVRFFERNPTAAIVTPATPALDNILSANSYQKGAWFLHMLRRLVGDEVFWKGISTYYMRHLHGNALTEDFQRAMEDVSGRPLQAFFRQWVYTPGQPVIQGSWTYADGVLTVELHQTQPTETLYTTAIDIGIVTDRLAAPRIEVVQFAQRDQTFTVALDKEPVDVALDPNTWLLMQAGAFTRKDRAR